MDEDKPNTDNDETWRCVFASAFVFSCCNSLRESVLRALGTCRYWRCYMEPKLWFVQYDDKIWSGNTVKGIQAQQGWNCIDIQVGTIVEKKGLLKVLRFQLPWLKWTWAKTISSLQVRSQVQKLNWYSPPILARLIFWCGGNKMEVDKLVCYAFGALVIPRQGPIL